MSSVPIPPLYDDDDIARARAANAVLLTQESARALWAYMQRECVTAPDVMEAIRELDRAVCPPAPRPFVAFQVKRKVRR